MIIGIVDCDILDRKFSPNLDAMKISAFYKSQKSIVKLITKFEQLHIYDKIILRKDTIDVNFPSKLFLLPNIEYGGLAFNNGNYEPLPPEIEKCRPDIGLYDKFLINKGTKESKKDLNRMRSSAFMRLSLDGQTCNNKLDIENPLGRRILIYDNNLPKLENCVKLILEIRNKRRVFLVHPQELTNLEEVYEWTRQVGFSQTAKLRYVNFKEEELNELVQESKSFKIPIEIPLGAGFNQKTGMKDIKKYLIRWMNEAAWLVTHGYDKIRFYVSPTLKENIYNFLFEALVVWARNGWKYNTYKDYIRKRYTFWHIAVLDRLEELEGNNVYSLFNTDIKEYMEKGGKWER